MALNIRRGLRLRSPAIALAAALMLSFFPFQPQPDLIEAQGAMVGSGALALFSPQELEEAYGFPVAKLPSESVDKAYYQALSAIKTGGLKKLVLCLDLSEASDQFEPDEPQSPSAMEKVGDPAKYEEEYGAYFTDIPVIFHLNRTDKALKAVNKLYALCQRNKVDMSVILVPLHISRYSSIDGQELMNYKKALAGICPVWDFSCSAASCESRYFYNRDRARASLCSMMLRRISGKEGYMIEDFGQLLTRDTAEELLALQAERAPEADPADYTVDVPILLYHHITSNPKSNSEVSYTTFKKHMQAIKKAGYTAVTTAQMIDYVENGAPLPEKPILITFDDGYLSNYTYAYPLLRSLGLKATIFTIGSSIGHSSYKDTRQKITPHFTLKQAQEMMASGVIEIQSHTYDLHQWADYEEEPDSVRPTAQQLEGENMHQYAVALREDFEKYKAEYGWDFYALAYPKGQYSEMSEQVFHSLGVKLTVSTLSDRRNVLIKGAPESLYALCRYVVPNSTSNTKLLAMIAGE